MKILVYEAMPDIGRAEIVLGLAGKYISEGHTVFLLLDEETFLLNRNDITAPHVINCINIIRSRFPATHIPFFSVPRNKKLRKLFLRKATNKALAKIEDYKSKFYRKILEEFQPDAIYIWNGLMDYQQAFIRCSQKINPHQKYYFLEAGWFPQKGTYYEDTLGVNAKSHIAQTTPNSLTPEETKKIKAWKKDKIKANGNFQACDKDYYFVPLQLESDSNIKYFSPFPTMEKFVSWIIKNTNNEVQIVVRPHPLDKTCKEKLAAMSNRVVVNTETPLNSLIASCKAVIGINSTVLLESLVYEKTVFALGKGLFQSSGAIFLQREDEKIPLTSSTPASMIARQEALLHLLISKQHHIPTFTQKKINQPHLNVTNTKFNKGLQLLSKIKINLKKLLYFK
ncbi:hypothetical protein ACJJI4_11895 [Microbulbifer sp. TRSA002]|uniref:capsular polysaccharide export protein, LipB/KpsS family n=1 Tax=Microbulbifer sp. TRSA002 TaxID=3243382 RepID=UPI00403A1794